MQTLNIVTFLGIFSSVIEVLSSNTSHQDQVPTIRNRRGVGGNYDLFGNSRQAAFDELYGHQNVALLSAQYAVTSSIGQVYGQQQEHLAKMAKRFSTFNILDHYHRPLGSSNKGPYRISRHPEAKSFHSLEEPRRRKSKPYRIRRIKQNKREQEQ